MYLSFRCFVVSGLLLVVGCGSPDPETLRVATYNIEDVRTDDLLNPDHVRLKALAARLQSIRPDVVLINEIAYDEPGVPGFASGDAPGQNGQRLADNFLAVSQGEGLAPLRYKAFMAPSNTGRNSGYDLNRNGEAATEFPPPPSAGSDGAPAAQTASGRAYGDDSWGFGTFPGQYALAVLVRDDLSIGDTRTFRYFPWSSMPDARRPVNPEDDSWWYNDEVWEQFPVSSKSHWDVPVVMPDGRTLHVLASHPTPAAFDGPEMRNKLRNHEEIRFWSLYINGSDVIVDDAGVQGGLTPDASFMIMGDLNADPDEGSSVDNPIGTWLLSDARVNGAIVPVADAAGQAAFPDLDPDDTARWGLRVDYVLPSADLSIAGSAIVRPSSADEAALSDHFPVWVDVLLNK